MGDVLQSPEVDALVVSELLGAQVSVIFDDFTDDFGRVEFFLGVHVAELALLSVATLVHLPPFARLFFQ